jgi:hypothetical protein
VLNRFSQGFPTKSLDARRGLVFAPSQRAKFDPSMTSRSSDRRQSPRYRLAPDHGSLSAQIRPGHQVRLVDISATGALIEAAHRLLPGRVVKLQIERAEQRVTLEGRLLRCTVTGLQSSSVCYRAAIAFDHRLHWLDAGSRSTRTIEKRVDGNDG